MDSKVIGTIERRILVNYAADPEIAKSLIPSDLKLQLINGKAVVGVCLIRLTNLRPKWLPPIFGLTSENIAHRIAIEYNDDSESATGVYVPIRHTNSLLSTYVGSRMYPGVYKMAKFHTHETDTQHKVSAISRDKTMSIEIDAIETSDFSSNLFSNFDEASNFFKCSSVGFSPDRQGCELEGIELKTNKWEMTPLKVSSIRSSTYDDLKVFPKGSIEFDSALIMKDIDVTWNAKKTAEL